MTGRPTRSTYNATRRSSPVRFPSSRAASSATPDSRRRTLRGGRLLGWQTISGLVEQCVRAVAAGERFVYAYYPGVDTVAHEFGLHDARVPA